MKGIDGASEYAIYGWAKWTHPPAGVNTWHLLLRFNCFPPNA